MSLRFHIKTFRKDNNIILIVKTKYTLNNKETFKLMVYCYFYTSGNIFIIMFN